MNVFIIGSGGREHAIAHKISQSPRLKRLYVAPGNAGIEAIAQCVPIEVHDIQGLCQFAKAHHIDMTIVGPEQPLVLGIVDVFEKEGLRIVGPNQHAAQFEGSKDFTKKFLIKSGIPTAASETFTTFDDALNALPRFGFPVVIKADGLAAGKGVVIAGCHHEAVKALMEMMNDAVFGEAGRTVVMETYLTGTEASILCFCDGKTILPMAPAQDYKRALDGDQGLNTGGMGTYSPSRIIDDACMARIQRDILDPFIVGIEREKIAFKGILFVGLMLDGNDIKVLEYNVRMGDPETEVTLPRLENDLLDIFDALLDQRLSDIKLSWRKEAAVCVIMASGGYPENYEKGYAIHGLDHVKDAFVYHCGTKRVKDLVVTSGGRVLGVTALGPDLNSAIKKAYDSVGHITFEHVFYRTDIGK